MSESSTDLASTAAETSGEGLLPQLVKHLRQKRTVLRESGPPDPQGELRGYDPRRFSEATAVYDATSVLETGSVEALQAYARDLPTPLIPRAWRPTRCSALCCCATCSRGRFRGRRPTSMLNRVLGACEPAASPTPWVSASCRSAGASFASSPGGHPGAVHAPAGARAASPADHRRAGPSQRARQITERLCARSAPTAPGRRHRHHRGVPPSFHGGQPPGTDRRRIRPDGCKRDHHRPVIGYRVDPVTIGPDLSR